MTSATRPEWAADPDRDAILPFNNPIRAEKLGLLYFPVPKNASTTIKSFLYENAWGKTFRATYPKRNVHRFFDALERFDPTAITAAPHLEPFVVLRDPVRRLLSAYSNRVIHNRALETHQGLSDELAAIGLSTQPDPDTFFTRIGEFRRLSFEMRFHTEPTAYFVGDDLGRFSHVHRIEAVDALTEFLSERVGEPIVLGRHQTGGPKVTPGDLSLEARRALDRFVEPDFALLGKFYPNTRLDLVGSASSRIKVPAWTRVFGARS